MQTWLRRGALAAVLALAAAAQSAQAPAAAGRERLLMDFGWRFAFGHPYDAQKDFGYGTAAFFFGKAGYGDGAASASFDDRGWRTLNLPHDWAVELPFDRNTNGNHGSRAVGRNFPQNNVGWYRKTFTVPASDLGRRIGIEFDGVYRDSVVWINGHYLGNEHSGYSSFAYDLTDYLNYGGANTIAVRVDAAVEEGWFYEGAGIYRHVWLTKTAPLHVARYGTFVTTEVAGPSAAVNARVSIVNEGTAGATFTITQSIVDAAGKPVAAGLPRQATLRAGDTGEFSTVVRVASPKLWSIESPYLHKLVTTIRSGGAVVDRYETTFGVRTVRFDAKEGFFLNGKHVKLKGTNNHQDHAGVGNALPDALQDFRIARLKEMGGNAYRTSHNPPTPELLDACDRLGMVVIDEHRMMGTSPEILDQLKRLILRDRNHPSVVIWSVGNEEWAIEGRVAGTRLTASMEAFVKRLDPTRRVTVAMSGGSGSGSSISTDVMGFNYLSQHNIDKYHSDFPEKPGIVTEEGSTNATRGIYVDDRPNVHLAAYDRKARANSSSIEEGWTFNAARPFLAGMFVWTGFDYRGEPTPFGWPAVSSQFGMLDTCGFFKDSGYYLQAWWTEKPMVHLLPHWNWPGKEGQEIDVWAYSNTDDVELLLNGQSLGRQAMKKNSHVEWKVKYQPGTLMARGYKDGSVAASDSVSTAGDAAAIQLTPDRAKIQADGEDVSVIAVRVNDSQGRTVPTAANRVTFSVRGPGRIIGVGNGDPGSHEADRYVESVSLVSVPNWRVKAVDAATENRPEVAFDFDDSAWQRPMGGGRGGANANQPAPAANVYRGGFELPEVAGAAKVSLLFRAVGDEQSVYVNGRPVAQKLRRNNAGHELDVPGGLLRPGRNVVAIVATPIEGGRGQGQGQGRGAGVASIRVLTPAPDWQRSAFNGLAQAIVQSTGEPGEIAITATSPGLSQKELRIQAAPATRRPAVPAQ
jgi:beta-galactosidase